MYKVDFDDSMGQYKGVHTFFTKKSMERFVAKAIRLGYTSFKYL